VTALGPDEVARYGRDGYLVCHRPLFAAPQFDRLRAIFHSHLEDRGDRRTDELRTPHYDDPRLLDFLLADDVLDVVAALIGPDIVLRASNFISKEPLTGRATPWHQDVDYFRRSGMLSSYDGLTTIWLALSESDRGNGCMRVVAGSRSRRFTDHLPVDTSSHTFDTGIDGVAEEDAVDLELAPGEFSIHDGWVIHGARPNRSDRPRSGFVMGYMPATTIPDPARAAGWRFWLARGEPAPGVSYEDRL